MAVLKYKSNGTIKTLGVVESGVSGVSSINGKTGSITGVYDTNNQPPYPVTSVDGKTGAIRTYNIVTLDSNIASKMFTINKGFNIVINIPIIRSGSSLSAGNTSPITATINKSNVINILGISLQNNAYDAQCTAYTNGNIIGIVLTNNSGEGETISDIKCTAFIYSNEDNITINLGV